MYLMFINLRMFIISLVAINFLSPSMTIMNDVSLESFCALGGSETATTPSERSVSRALPELALKPLSIDELKTAQRLLDYRLMLTERQLLSLWRERASLISRRQELAREVQAISAHSTEHLPLSHIASFLSASEVVALSASSSLFKSALSQQSRLVVPHMSIQAANLTERYCNRLFSRICVPSIQSLRIDSRLQSNGALLYALAPHAHLLTSLRSFTLTGGAVTEELTNNLLHLFRCIPKDTLHSMHLSGLKKLTVVGELLCSHKNSLRSVRVDYLVAGHESDVNASILPVMPELRSLTFDVASLSEAKATVVTSMLHAIKNKSGLQKLYIPHVQLLGSADELRELTDLLPKFTGIKQVVLRFMNLCLPLEEVIGLRRALPLLPCFIVSREFLVAMDAWASWWPVITDVWGSEAQINGISVFREQVDFSSFGANAEKEWLRLPKQDKAFWRQQIAPRVVSLFNTVHRNLKFHHK